MCARPRETQPSSPSVLPTDFPLTHSLQPPCCCLSTPGTLPPQGLCTGSALCLDHSSQHPSGSSLTSVRSWLRCHPLRWPFLDPHLLLHHPLLFPLGSLLSCFVFWLRCMVSGMSLSQAGTEHGPWQWKHELLITRPPGNSLLLFFFSNY